MYLIKETYYSEGKIKWNGIVHSNLRRETIFTVSDRWREFLCPFGRKELDERKSSDKNMEYF